MGSYEIGKLGSSKVMNLGSYEVRKLGIDIGVEPKLINRHPFPGPGLAVRILGEVKVEYANILRKADDIFIEMLNEKKLTDQMGDSIKDEIWTIWFVLVLTGCFLPWTQEYVKNGFIFLDQHTPSWFHNLLYVVIGVIKYLDCRHLEMCIRDWCT